MERKTISMKHVGCWVDGAHGHYAMPEMIKMAGTYGYILDPFAEYTLSMYDAHYHEDGYPNQAITELADEVEEWLNCGDNSPDDPARIQGQNAPPVVPAGFYWGWNDGDFGLYPQESDESYALPGGQ